MDKESYLYFLNPDDPLFPEKSSIVRNLHEIEKTILNIRRDKENLFLFLMTIIITIFIGFFIQERNFILISLLLIFLIGLIIWRVNSYSKEEAKLSKFFDEMRVLRDSYSIPKAPIK
jgi:hypothetical protein